MFVLTCPMNVILTMAALSDLVTSISIASRWIVYLYIWLLLTGHLNPLISKNSFMIAVTRWRMAGWSGGRMTTQYTILVASRSVWRRKIALKSSTLRTLLAATPLPTLMMTYHSLSLSLSLPLSLSFPLFLDLSLTLLLPYYNHVPVNLQLSCFITIFPLLIDEAK